MITLIVAAGNNNEIGKDNQLLWHLPDDLKHFKKRTLHQTIIMGRKTFESLPGVLPKRHHIVISRNPNFSSDHPNVDVVASLEEALQKAQSEEIFIVGGGNIYTQTITLADRIEMTRVNTTVEADTYFPEIPENEFELIRRVYHPKDEKHAFDFEILSYRRKSST